MQCYHFAFFPSFYYHLDIDKRFTFSSRCESSLHQLHNETINLNASSFMRTIKLNKISHFCVEFFTNDFFCYSNSLKEIILYICTFISSDYTSIGTSLIVKCALLVEIIWEKRNWIFHQETRAAFHMKRNTCLVQSDVLNYYFKRSMLSILKITDFHSKFVKIIKRFIPILASPLTSCNDLLKRRWNHFEEFFFCTNLVKFIWICKLSLYEFE